MTDYTFAKSFAIDLDEKAITEEESHYKLTGYAAKFNNVDRVNDIIIPGAFAKSLAQRERDGDDLQLYYNHKVEDVPIGRVSKCWEDRHGLKYEALLPKDDVFVSTRIYPQIKSRSLKSNSFGYKVKSSERRKADGVRLLKEIDIYEISVVNVPANPGAGVESIKGLVPYQELPVGVKDLPWDAEAAYQRLVQRFGTGDDLKRCFIFVDEDKPADQWDRKLLIADIDPESKMLCANRNAIYKAVASISTGQRIPEDATEAVKAHLERYYDSLALDSPWKSISVSEWKALDLGEREARLKGCGVSVDLAKVLAATQIGGPREVDRKQSPREVGSAQETEALLKLFSAMSETAAAILKPR
jgi:HK97 family phage prohead protease